MQKFTVAYWGKPNTRVTSRKVGTVGCGTKTPEGARKSESLGRRRHLASSNLLSQPVLIGDQFVSEAITCTTAGFALATISGIVVAAEQPTKRRNKLAL